LFEQGAIDAICLTICPLVLGGTTAPDPVAGVGFLAALAPRLRLLECQPIGDEVFLRYAVTRSGGEAT
jgi:5-amino-6-(5-phosphoribosylamino)uracil reductase